MSRPHELRQRTPRPATGCFRARSRRPGLRRGAAQSARRRSHSRRRSRQKSLVRLRRSLQRGILSRRRPRRSHQRVPVRRRRGRGGFVERTSLQTTAASNGNSARPVSRPKNATRSGSAIKTGCCGISCCRKFRKSPARKPPNFLSESLAAAGVKREHIAGWILHTGGRDVLLALRDKLGLSESDVRHSAAVLREFGNISSPTVYFVLERALHDTVPDGLWWMSSFGAGFSCHGALLEVEMNFNSMGGASVPASRLNETHRPTRTARYACRRTIRAPSARAAICAASTPGCAITQSWPCR